MQLSSVLREQLNRKGCVTSLFIDSIPLKYNNNTSYNTSRRHVNVLVNYLHANGFPIEQSKLKTRKQEEVLHSPIKDVKQLLFRVKEYNEKLVLMLPSYLWLFITSTSRNKTIKVGGF